MEKFSFRLSEEDYTKFMSRVDPEHKGYISYHRFLEIFENKPKVGDHRNVSPCSIRQGLFYRLAKSQASLTLSENKPNVGDYSNVSTCYNVVSVRFFSIDLRIPSPSLTLTKDLTFSVWDIVVTILHRVIQFK